VRGGSYLESADTSHPAVRRYDPPGSMTYATGVRAARSLAPGGGRSSR